MPALKKSILRTYKLSNWKRYCSCLYQSREILSRFYRYSSTSSKNVKGKIDMTKFPAKNIRNFGIIAHIDHGKSTLSDRLLEFTGTISKSEKHQQFLDKLPVEKERGITVKAQSASMFYEYNGETYLLNLIDTPGHVDFSYEVSRSLTACQGVILLVDANQGVQAQTVANFALALCSELTVIPVLNKIDLKNADVEGVANQMESIFGISKADILKVSAKFGTGIEELLKEIIEKIPMPSGDLNKSFRAQLFDSWFDQYRGVIAMLSIIDGKISIGDEISSYLTGQSYEVKDMGILHPEETPVTTLCSGQAGYIVANIKNAKDARIGDTFSYKNQKVEPLSEFQPAKPMVFAGIYPEDQSQNAALRSAIEKLLLTDSSISIAMEVSPALGQGWRLGFLGLLHMEVFCQRLDQEFDAQVVMTAPNVPYKVKIFGQKNIKAYGSEEILLKNPLQLPDPQIVKEYFEPMVLGTIIVPSAYVNNVLEICRNRRGVQKHSQNIDDKTSMLQFKLPLNEIIVDFYDELKSVTSGYGSFDYEDIGYESSDLIKIDILLNGQIVDELSTITHASTARQSARRMCLKLKETIPQQLYTVAIQAAIGSKIIVRENIKALRKNVTAKCYGGDVTRKMKLLSKQAEGKRKMRMIGKVEVPRDCFIKVLKR